MLREAERTRALLAGQIRVLELIATGAPLEQTLSNLCTLMESLAEGMFASILLVEEDGVHVHHVAAPNLPKGYIEAIDGLSIGPAAGSCGTAMYRREQVIVSDIQSDPLWEGYRQLAAPFGLRACWSSPIISAGGQVLGSFAMYYKEVRMPSSDELRLIDVAALMASIAIERK